ncbi:MAG: ABC transporter permease [Flavobacteriaceae bacterium]|nr:ABC transporter permease [Flavobacteriaceae bacterium]
MNFETYMANRFRKSKTYKSTVSSPIIKISVSSIVIGIIMMLISISSSVGLQNTIKTKVSSLFGHISISNFKNNNSFSSLEPVKIDSENKSWESNSRIINIQYVAYKSGLIINKKSFEGVIFKGVSSNFNWNVFSNYIIDGNVINTSNELTNNVIISEYLSKKLSLELNQKFKTTFYKSNSIASPNERIFKVAGIYKSGFNEFDEVYFLGDIRHIQRMNKWKSDEIGNIEVLINDFNEIDNVTKQLYNETSSALNVQSIKEIYPDIFNWIALFDINVLLIIIIMILIGGINMITALLVTVLEKASLIGVLKTLGSSNNSIRTIFLINGTYLISQGMIIGNVISILIIFLQNKTGFIKLDPESYYISELPFDFNFSSILFLNIGVLVLCFLMLIIPSLIITKISPSESVKIN